MLLHQNNVIQRKKDGKEENLKHFQVERHPQPAERVGLAFSVNMGTLPGVGTKRLPEDDIAFPDAVDDRLDGLLPQKLLGARYDGNLKSVHLCKDGSKVRLFRAF